jgi:hypothetical protein
VRLADEARAVQAEMTKAMSEAKSERVRLESEPPARPTRPLETGLPS